MATFAAQAAIARPAWMAWMAATVKLSAIWRLPVPGGPSSSNPPCSGMKRTGGQIQDQHLGDLRIERPVEAVQRLQLWHPG